MSLKDMDIFIQHFIQKCVQIIVQSRLGTKATQSKCNPNGKDWFNINITDIKDIIDQTSKCLKLVSENTSSSLYFIKNDWKICCEISLQNSDGISLVLEYWIFSSTPAKCENVGESILTQNVKHTYILMSNMLKSLIVLTRSTPAYKLSSKGQSADSYVICYRVYKCDEVFSAEEQSNHYCTLKSLGTIKSVCNEISISLIYRTDMNANYESEIKNIAKINEELCGSGEFKEDHFTKEDNNKFDIKEIFEPINPAFANEKNDEPVLSSSVDIPFSSLLSETHDTPLESQTKSHHQSNETKSNPISIPENILSRNISKSPQIYSTSNESFVFVELNAPFASDDREISSFFHGPSPTFNNSYEDDTNDINELTEQLAELESNAVQIDSFVESICITESDEQKVEAC